MKDMTLSRQQLKELGEGQAWARRLAETLLGDVHLAEDAVQDAWLVALEGRSDLRQPGRWLGGVVHHLALGEVRSRARRRRREREAAANEALPSTAEIASRLEAQELLIDAVLSLDEPFRGTVLARYVEGLPQRKIATRDGVPVSTVNGRLTRGLQRIRASLDAKHGDGPGQWVPALIPLASQPATPKFAALAALLAMKKLLLAALVFALLVPLIQTWMPSGADVETSPDTLRTLVDWDASAEETTAQEDAAASLSPLASGAEPDRSAVPRGTIQPEEADDGLSGASLQTIRVVDAETGGEVPGAEVFVVSYRRLREAFRPGSAAVLSAEFPATNRAFIERYGRRFVADENGTARVPLPEAGAIAEVRAGDRHAHAYLSGAVDEREIEIAPDRLLTVDVRGVDGKAVEGARVELSQEIRDDGEILFRSVSSARAVLKDGKSIATLRHAAGIGRDVDECRWRILVDGALGSSETGRVSLERWPTETVVLNLVHADARALEVRVPEAQGGRSISVLSPDIGDGSGVQLLAASELGALPNPLLSNRGEILEGGAAWILPVGPGIEVVGVVWPKGDGLPFTGLGRAPLSATAEGTLELDPWGAGNRVVGRLVDQDGNGLSNHRLDVRLAGKVWIPNGLRTGADGRFEWRINLEAPPYVGHDLLLYEPGHPYRLKKLLADRLATAKRMAQRVQSPVDLGDVLLPDPPPSPAKVQGRVVNAAGEGVASTPVYWADVGPAGTSIRYRTQARPGSSRAAGAFQIDEIELGPETTLIAQPDGNYVYEPIPFHELRRDDSGAVLIELQEGLVIVGQVLLDEHVPASGISIAAWPLDSGPVPERASVAGWVDGRMETDSSFRIEGLRPGQYCVRAGVGGDHKAAALSPSVELIGGAGSAAAQTAPLDLRGRLGVFHSRVTNEEGIRLNTAIYMSAPKESGGKQVYGFPELLGSTWKRGQSIVYPECTGALLMVQRNGYFPTVIDPKSAPDVVVLKRGFEIDLQITSGANLDGCPGNLKVELLPLHREERLPRQIQRSLDVRSLAQGVLDSNGRVRLSVPGAGEYRVQLRIDYQTRPGYGIGRSLKPAEPFTVVVSPPGESVFSYDVEIPAATYQRALDVVRQRFDNEVERSVIPSTLRFGETHVE